MQLNFEEFILVQIHVPPSSLNLQRDSQLNLNQELGSFSERSTNPTTKTNTPKFVEEVGEKIMKGDKAVELFQTMMIVSLNMENLTLEVNTVKDKLVMGEKEKVVLQEELGQERTF